jgi:hypothetical protein
VTDFERYERKRAAWNAKHAGLCAKRRHAKDDIERLTRDAAAARLAVLDAKLHYRDLEKQMDQLRQTKPRAP